jgi:uncharacterized protein
MYQRWSDLLFLHWRWSPIDLQRRLPPGLFIDYHDGDAWLGIVPFFMQRIRPRFLPAVPGLSWFHELNVRTYVHDKNGVPGVWFFSLDCDQPLAVRIAQTLYRLPYHDASMASSNRQGCIHYECQRIDHRVASIYDYQLRSHTRIAEPGTLDFFLIERYVLFAQTRQGLLQGHVQHQPYPLCDVSVQTHDQLPLLWNRFTIVNRPPDHIIGSKGVDVRVGRLVQS